jgi:hypothetical protein
MSLLRSQMRNQQINYCFGAPSLRQFRECKVNQGRQSLALHLATDITDRLELGFEPFPPATLSISPTSATRAKKIGKLLILRSRIFKGRHYKLDFLVRR